MPFVKSNPRAPDGFFEAEAAGLAWLAEAETQGGARTARVESVSAGRIEIEQLESARPTPDAAARFGRALAVTHRAGAQAFGSAPHGWNGPTFIGARPMQCRPERTWGRFYSEQRVRPFLEIALSVGSIDAVAADHVFAVCELLESGAADDGEPARRIHGDLWNGNVMWTSDEAVLIDPAAHGGHRETDLAMLTLFGAPHLDVIVDAYDDEFALRPGWRERIALHQLHPLAVHAAGHGASYGHALAEAARKALDLF
ncbi:fructosamine kinase family protein [Agreia pratensis]|uniref:fructosamine kinase family protein n=1 Tax=Agreia pratensis TaxID=150121 RepID=UPI00188D3B91|nr:fructosamine kinase family protein [Agreia pratensis]MBF4635397.1 fructosamine kinase family protein [Agreia pratensis]